jgi:N-methylhydantoinase B
MTTDNLGPVRLEVILSILTAIAEEMGIVLRRTARSTTVREMADFSTGIFDAQGRNVAQNVSSPMALTLAPCLEQVLADHLPPDHWEDGDVVLLNDPYCGSQHLPDILTFRAVFVGGERVGFVGVMAHHVDVGGGAPGSYDLSAREIFAEGLRIPPVRIRRRGVLVDDLLSLVLQNVRQRETVRGDLLAQIACLEIGARGLGELCAKLGRETVQAAASRLIARSQAAMEEAIRALPDLSVSFDDFLDDDGIGGPPIRVAVDLTVLGDRLVLDFSRSGLQVPAPINCTRNVLQASVHYCIAAVLGTDIPINSGCFLPVEVRATRGLVVNAEPPAPVVNRMTVAHRIVTATMGALAAVLPDRIPASYYGVSYVYMVETVEHDGARRIYFDSEVGGWGGEPGKDGANAFSCGLHNIAAVPVEMLERLYPIRFRRYALRPGSGGEGMHRGGVGLIREWELLAASGTFAATFDRFVYPPFGVQGGGCGAGGRLTVVRDGVETSLGSKISKLPLFVGDIVRIETSGGGGFGEPGARDPAAIAFDLDEGYVSNPPMGSAAATVNLG